MTSTKPGPSSGVITDETLKTVQSAWDTLNSCSQILRNFDDFNRSWIFDRKTDGASRIADMFIKMIDRFQSRLVALDTLLIRDRHEVELRRIYEPFCVKFTGCFTEPNTLHESYSQAVWKCAMVLYGALPIDDADENSEKWFCGERKPGEPLPNIDYNLMFNDGETIPETRRFGMYFKHRDFVLENKFDTVELLIHLGREFTTVADRHGSAKSQPAASSPEYSPWIDAKRMIELMKSNGDTSTEEWSVGRRKKQWGSESQSGSNNRVFRFRLTRLRNLSIKYPSEWDEPSV